MTRSEINNKEIIYPILIECVQYTEDTFWENIFEDLSYGKAPYGIYFSKGFLCCNMKNKEFSYKIEQKNPKTLHDDIYILLNKKAGILSQHDKIKKKLDFKFIEEEIKEGRKYWTSIRKKNIKDLLIENYVIRMKNKYELTNSQAKYLLSLIFIGMVFKIFTVKDIHYSDGIITNIEGISFKKKQIVQDRDVYDIDIPSTCILIDETHLMSDNWSKYLDTLRKIDVY